MYVRERRSSRGVINGMIGSGVAHTPVYTQRGMCEGRVCGVQFWGLYPVASVLEGIGGERDAGPGLACEESGEGDVHASNICLDRNTH